MVAISMVEMLRGAGRPSERAPRLAHGEGSQQGVTGDRLRQLVEDGEGAIIVGAGANSPTGASTLDGLTGCQEKRRIRYQAPWLQPARCWTRSSS